MSFNRATLIGNLGDDPALQVDPTGQAEASFWVGTDEAFRDEIQGRLEWQRVVRPIVSINVKCGSLRNPANPRSVLFGSA